MISNSNVTFWSHGKVASPAMSIHPCSALGGRQQHLGMPLHHKGRGGAALRLQIERNAANIHHYDVTDGLIPEKWQSSQSYWQDSQRC